MNAPKSEWLATVARVGYVTKGILYLMLGSLAVAAAVGAGGKVSGSEGVLETVAAQPFGRVLLTAVAVGLMAYAAWRGVQAIWDPEHDGSDDAKRGFQRVAFGVSGLTHILLAYTAIDMAWLGGGPGGSSKHSLIAKLLSEGWGQWVVGLAGVAIGVFALTKLRHVTNSKFMEKFETAKMSTTQQQWVERIGRAGHGARVVVFGIISSMVVYAAISTDPDKAKSTGGALRELLSQPFGSVLLGVVAAGLALYGVHQFSKARWRVVAA